MKRYFAFWVVSLVFASLAGLIVASIDYFTAQTVTEKHGQCLDTLFSGCARDPLSMFGVYPLSAFAMMLVLYPIFRAVVGSFKLVFHSEKTI
jgi:hypothetical protein